MKHHADHGAGRTTRTGPGVPRARQARGTPPLIPPAPPVCDRPGTVSSLKGILRGTLPKPGRAGTEGTF